MCQNHRGVCRHVKKQECTLGSVRQNCDFPGNILWIGSLTRIPDLQLHGILFDFKKRVSDALWGTESATAGSLAFTSSRDSGTVDLRYHKYLLHRWSRKEGQGHVSPNPVHLYQELLDTQTQGTGAESGQRPLPRPPCVSQLWGRGPQGPSVISVSKPSRQITS